MTRRDLVIFVASAGILLILALAVNTPDLASGNLHFAGEYGHIAASLVRGNGYSDPFDSGGGPTAWMPPLYTGLLAAVFALCGTKTAAAAWCLILIKSLGLAVVAVLLHRLARQSASAGAALWILPVYLLFLAESFWSSFLQMHDIWLQMLVVTVIVYADPGSRPGSRGALASWGVVGGLATLTNPVFGLIFAALTFLPRARAPLAGRAAAAAIAVAICLPWTIRNYVVFDRLVPVKSNLSFELYQANVADDDGILDDETFLAHHPFSNEEVRREFSGLGESRFLAARRAEFLRELERRPGVYVGRTARRFAAAYLVPLPTDRPPYGGGLIGAAEIAVYVAPAGCALLVLLLGRGRRNPVFASTLVSCALYLLPYVLVGFYYRYRRPLIPLFALLVFLAATEVLRLRRRPSSGSSARRRRLLDPPRR